MVEESFWTLHAFVTYCIAQRISDKSPSAVSLCPFNSELDVSARRRPLATHSEHKNYKKLVFLFRLINNKQKNLFVCVHLKQPNLLKHTNTKKISGKYLIPIIGIEFNFKGVRKPFSTTIRTNAGGD